MIYISSSGVKADKINESVEILAKEGFQNIELSGGTQPYPELEHDLIRLKKEYGLNYLVHNYFPPPENPFVLNLASLNDDTFSKSFEHCKKAIELAIKLESEKIAFHAGFFIDIRLSDIGKKLTRDNLFDQEISTQKFCEAFEQLKTFADNEIKLYIENNVINSENHETYDHTNPLMLTCINEYNNLKSKLDFTPLIDIAHLKVSAHTLGLDFENEMRTLLNKTDYIHVSDNDGLKDSNNSMEENGSIYQFLSRNPEFIKQKTITLEVYDTISEIKSSYNLIQNIYND